MSGMDGAAGDCVAMVQESWETCSNGAVLLLKMVFWGGVATWNVGFLSQRCLGCVRDLGVRGDLLADSVAGGYGASHSKQAAQLSPGAALPALCLISFNFVP